MNITWILTAIISLLLLRSSLAKLRLIQTVFRHGNRNPTNGKALYPNDPYINMTYVPEGLGGLTNTGKMSAYKLGQYFRDRYDEFLGRIYKKEEIWFCSDQMERVVMTGELVAAGMYPPYEEQNWNPNLNWQPIPIWPPPNDYLYNGMFCDNTYKWRANVEKTDGDVIKFVKENEKVYKYLSQHAGGNITQHGMFSFRQNLYAQRDIGLKLPAWAKQMFLSGKLDELAAFDIIIRTRTIQLKKLLGGIWLSEWLKHINDHLHKGNTQKAFMYAGHDLTIAYILAALDNFDNKIPSYSSTLMFELHEEGNEHFVQIHYKDKDNVRTLKLPGCETNNKLCPLESFKNSIKHLLPEDVEALCGNTRMRVNQ